VVVADLSRLGGRPQASMRNLNALKGAGLTLHAATGTLSGPVLEECIAATMFEFAAADARHFLEKHGTGR